MGCAPKLFFISLAAFTSFAYSQGPSTPASCDRLTLAQCETFVTKELGKLQASDVKSAVSLSQIWSDRFRQAYSASIKKGPSSSDIDKIEEKILDELDPLEKIKSKATELMLAKYFSRLATWLAFIGSNPVKGLLLFLTPSEVASSYDEAIQANNRVQERLHALLEPNLRADWRKIYLKELKDAGPAIGPGKP